MSQKVFGNYNQDFATILRETESKFFVCDHSLYSYLEDTMRLRSSQLTEPFFLQMPSSYAIFGIKMSQWL